jgi:hypothetical protein
MTSCAFERSRPDKSTFEGVNPSGPAVALSPPPASEPVSEPVSETLPESLPPPSGVAVPEEPHAPTKKKRVTNKLRR